MGIPLPVQEALRDSIASGKFVDTKFWVFSKRSSRSGRVGEPKALFANGHVVRNVSQLGALLNQRESGENLRTQFPVDRRSSTRDYDYDADSDLEEDEDWDPSDIEDTRVVPSKYKSDKSDSATLIGSQNSDAKGNESPDVISVSDMDSLLSDSADTKAGAEVAATSNPTHVGTVVVIEDVAFVTFQALLRYLYTNEIEFAPWGSAERRKARAREEITESYEPPKPSPKSIYRLADKYNIPKLKELALRQIQRDLCKCDIVEEVFSKYTSRYPELRELELEQLAHTLLSTDSGPALDALKDKIKVYTRGQLPHAKEILTALYGLLERNEPFKKIPVQSPALSKLGTASKDWKRLKDALTWSLTSGSFLDSQFYVLDSRPPAGPPKIRPIYFCSMASGIFSSKLVKHSSRIWPSGKTPLQCIDDYDSDLDDEESDTGIATNTYSHSASIPEDPLPTYKAPAPALVLRSGTAKTWSAIFFYMYTSQITFAPIGSKSTKETASNEGPPSSISDPPQNSEAASASPSKTATTGACSPKSVYALTSKIDLDCLCDLAFDNIKSQLDKNNIVQELFSPFTADHERIRQMEHKLFYSKLKPSVEDSTLFEIIGSSSSGEKPHRAASMELIFERSIREHKERIAAGAKESKTQPPPADPSVTDKKPTMGKKPAMNEEPAVGEKPVTTTEPAPVKPKKRQPPSSKPANQPSPIFAKWLPSMQDVVSD